MMMDWYYEQKEKALPVTAETLAQLKNKKFTSGREIHIGDYVFFGLLEEPARNPVDLDQQPTFTGEGVVTELQIPQRQLTMITFHFDEINVLYKSQDIGYGAFPRLNNIEQ
jgi:hypothetical protein